MIKVFFWDFDGVILNSNAIRDAGFEKVLSEFPKEQVNQLIDFHRINGGLSRYVKFRYFFEKIRKENITDKQLIDWANRFSLIMKQLLINPKLLIRDSIDFIKNNQGKYKMHITSGSDQEELRFLCKELLIEHYFESIHGSPTPKKQIVHELIQLNCYDKSECILVGDSINDYDAAITNGILFAGYNNEALKKMNSYYLNQCADIMSIKV